MGQTVSKEKLDAATTGGTGQAAAAATPRIVESSLADDEMKMMSIRSRRLAGLSKIFETPPIDVKGSASTSSSSSSSSSSAAPSMLSSSSSSRRTTTIDDALLFGDFDASQRQRQRQHSFRSTSTPTSAETLALIIAESPSEETLAQMNADQLRAQLLLEREKLVHAAVEAEFHRRAVQRDNEFLTHQYDSHSLSNTCDCVVLFLLLCI
jgi:hypothetical protein